MKTLFFWGFLFLDSIRNAKKRQLYYIIQKSGLITALINIRFRISKHIRQTRVIIIARIYIILGTQANGRLDAGRADRRRSKERRVQDISSPLENSNALKRARSLSLPNVRALSAYVVSAFDHDYSVARRSKASAVVYRDYQQMVRWHGGTVSEVVARRGVGKAAFIGRYDRGAPLS